jgi:hypothetical protein
MCSIPLPIGVDPVLWTPLKLIFEVSDAAFRTAYPPEFRRQILEGVPLHRCLKPLRFLAWVIGVPSDPPLNFHPTALRASAGFGPLPIVGPPDGGVFRPFGPLPDVGPPEGGVFRAYLTSAGWVRRREL